MRRFWQFPILCAAVAVLAVAVIDWSIIPVNEAGRHQWATAWLAGLARVLEFPALLVARKLKLHLVGRPEVLSWCFIMAGNVPLYLIAAAIVRWMWTAGQEVPYGASRGWQWPSRRRKSAQSGFAPALSACDL